MTVLVFESAIDELRNLNGVGARAHLVTEAGVHQHHGSLGEQTQVRGSSFAGGHVQRERNIDRYPIEAVCFGRFYLGKRKQGRDIYMASRPFSLEKDRLIERDDRSSLRVRY